MKEALDEVVYMRRLMHDANPSRSCDVNTFVVQGNALADEHFSAPQRQKRSDGASLMRSIGRCLRAVEQSTSLQ